MIFDVIEAKLIRGGFVAGRTMFRNYMPASISIGVQVRIPLTGIEVDENLPNFYKGQFQTIVRHTDVSEGAKVAHRVQKILITQAREYFEATEEHGEGYLDKIVPLTLPIQFPSLEGNAFEWSQMHKIVFGVKDLI